MNPCSSPRKAWLAAVATLSLATMALPSIAEAQTPAVRVRGTIDSVTATGIGVKPREGGDLMIMLPENARVVAVAKASLADIKAGSYVGVAALPRPDGSQMAIEVLIFPEAMRGAGEGFRPWDLMPESTMTNATVAETVTKSDGHTLTLKYKDGEKTIVVPAEAPIVTFVPAERSDLKPGVKIFTSVTKAADGSATASSVTVGKNGVDPPM